MLFFLSVLYIVAVWLVFRGVTHFVEKHYGKPGLYLLYILTGLIAGSYCLSQGWWVIGGVNVFSAFFHAYLLASYRKPDTEMN